MATAYRYGPEWDVEAESDPTTTYVVASTGRSGSTLLCRLLWDTGIAGMPEEYLHPGQLKPLAARWGCESVTEYMNVVQRKRQTPNGVFATKAHWWQFSSAAKQMPVQLGKMLGQSKFVFIERKDLVAQSISMHRAFETQAWVAELETPERDATYDFNRILSMRLELEQKNAEWEQFFEKNQITPHRVTYEELVEDMEGTLQATLDFVVGDIEPDAKHVQLPEVQTKRQANAQSIAWRARYAEDLADLRASVRANLEQMEAVHAPA